MSYGVIKAGTYKGKKFVILEIHQPSFIGTSLPTTWKTAYAEKPRRLPNNYSHKNYDDLVVPGGFLTFGDTLDHVPDLPEEFKGIYFLGYDYNHAYSPEYQYPAEAEEEVKSLIDQLLLLEELKYERT